MIYNKTDALEAVVNMAVADFHPTELREISAKLPDDNSEALGEFCDRFDLGEWFYDSLTVAEIDIADLLNSIAKESEKEAEEESEHQYGVNRDYQIANGWPV